MKLALPTAAGADQMELYHLYDTAEKIFRGQEEALTIEDIVLDEEEKTDTGRIKDQLNNMMISFCVNSNKANAGVVARLKQDNLQLKQRIQELEGQLKVKNDVQGIENVDENEEAKKDDRSILDTDADLRKV